MLFNEIVSEINGALGDGLVIAANEAVVQPYVEISPIDLPQVCRFLFESPALYFDYLACITGIDNGPAAGTMDVLYHLNSIPFGHSFIIKIVTGRQGPDGALPAVPTVSDIWRTADWHEREIYDLLGIDFQGHPDLRRILLPADWEGFPLRKDYQAQEYYHGIRVRYEDREDPGESEN